MNKPVYGREVFRRRALFPEFVVKPDVVQANAIADDMVKAFDFAMLPGPHKGINAMPVAEPEPVRVTEKQAVHTLPTENFGTLLGEGSGGGHFSKVYRGTVPGTVVKLSGSRGASEHGWDAWLLWAAYCMTCERRSRHLPDILAVHVDLDKMCFRAIMEELTPQTGDMSQRLAAIGRIERISTDKLRGNDAWQVKDMFNDMLDFLCFVGIKDDFFIDAHEDNWMYRGKVPVLTDPFSSVRDYTLPIVRELVKNSNARFTFSGEQS